MSGSTRNDQAKVLLYRHGQTPMQAAYLTSLRSTQCTGTKRAEVADAFIDVYDQLIHALKRLDAAVVI